MHPAATALLVGVGGAAGALARWGMGSWIKTLSSAAFPFPTFAVNLLGCFAIGVAYGLWGKHPVVLPLLIIGFLGAFTTFSTFGWETLNLMKDGKLTVAALYVALSAGIGVLLVGLGLKVAS